MRKTRKQLLGLAGLAAVAIMTAVACGMPAPDAAAEGDEGSGNMSLTVRVNEANTSLRINSPRNNSSTIDHVVKASVDFSETNKLEYYLTQKQADGSEKRVDLPEHIPPQKNGTDNFDIDLDALGLTFGDIQFHAIAYGDNNTVRDDTSAFQYSAIEANFEGAEENRDPILGIKLNDKVDYVLVHIYDAKGNPLFVDENGDEVPIKLNRDEIDPTTGKILTTLPFEKYDAESGDYRAVVVAYNDADQILSMVTAATAYLTPEDAVIPEIPNTGSLRIGSLNITRLDYLLTGLIAFAVVASFAIVLVYRKNRR